MTTRFINIYHKYHVINERHELKSQFSSIIAIFLLFQKELDAEQQKHVTDAMAEEKQRVLTLDELVDAVGRIQKVPDKDRIAKIVELLDEDRDGTINQVCCQPSINQLCCQPRGTVGKIMSTTSFASNLSDKISDEHASGKRRTD